MRVKFVAGVLLVGLVAVLLDPSSGQSQPPRGGGGNRGGGAGADRGARGGGGGGGNRGGFDADAMFDRFAQGGTTLTIATLPSFFRDRVDQWAKEKGITNGLLTREQYRDYSQASFGARPGAPGGPTPDPRGGGRAGGRNFDFDAWAEDTFKKLDKDGNGVLSYEEMSENLKAERDKWDTNKDGLIDREEFKEYLKAYRAKMQADRAENGGGVGGGSGNGPGTGGPVDGSEQKPPSELDRKVVVLRAGKLGDKMPEWFADYDVDGDAQIALWEWKEKGGELADFRKWDLNGDGFITPDEVLRVTALASKDGPAVPGGTRTASAAGPGGGNRAGRGNWPGQGAGGGPGGFRPGGGGGFPGFPGAGSPVIPGGGAGDPRGRMRTGQGGSGADNADNPDGGNRRGGRQGRNRNQ